MAGLVPAIHVDAADVDARAEKSAVANAYTRIVSGAPPWQPFHRPVLFSGHLL
jgi:hypothetical protein